MYNRFSNLVNDLKRQGKRFEIVKLVKKILRSLPESWTIKVTATKKSKDFTKLGPDELIGTFLTYEMKRKPKEEEEVKAKKDITLKVGDKKEEKRNFSMDEDDVNLLIRKFSKFLSRSKKHKGK